MKRGLKYRMLTALAAAFIAFICAAGWLLWTAAGARWLLGEVSRFAPVAIKAKEVEGRLWGELRIKDLSISWPQGSAEVREFTLRLSPERLVLGQFVASELGATGVTVRDRRPESAASPAFPWPILTGPPARLNARIDGLRLKGLDYHRLDEPPVVVQSLFMNIRLREGMLSAREIRLATPQFGVEGSVTMGLASPSLELEGSLAPASPLAAMSRFTARAHIRAGRAPGEAEGPVEITGMSGAAKTAALAGSIRIAGNEVRLTSLEGTLLSGTVSGGARAVWKEGVSVEGTLEARGINPAVIAPRLSGSLNFDVSGFFLMPPVKRPEGKISLHILRSRIQGQTFAGVATARVKQDHVSLDRFAFRGKGFELTGNGSSEKRVTMKARLSDLSHFVSGASGSVNLTGVVRRNKGRFSGEASAQGSKLIIHGVKTASSRLSVRIEDREGSPVSVKASLRDVTYDILHLETVTLNVSGRLPSGKLFDLSGTVSASRGSLRQRVGNVELKADLNRAGLSWTWRGAGVTGSLSLVLAGYGRIRADFSLPLPARFPVSFNRDGPIDVSLTGDLRETGTLSFLFPGVVQESRGRFVPHVRVTGTLGAPNLAGSLLLDGGSAYLPSAGIHVKDVRIHARLERDRIQIDSLSARSGPGSVEAKAVVILDGWRLVRFNGSFTGERFQLLYLPEIRALCSPKLEFEGTEKKMSVRGEVTASDILVTGPPKQAAVRPSEDVVIVGVGAPAKQRSPYAVDVRIKVVLGDRVFVKAEGVEAQLGGMVLLTAKSVREAAGTGEFQVIKGSYRANGVDLDITRGRMLFAGGPVDNPGLDILALRKTDDVRAGVRIGGVLQKPVVTLYSVPSMPDADVLSYMVLGHPLGQDKAQADSLMQAAAVLLSAGQNVSLRDQLRRRLGIDTIEVQGTGGGGGVSQSVVTVGKYLSPELYISYGRSISTGENLLRLRYEFSKHWELETKTGEASAVDLYYTIRFD